MKTLIVFSNLRWNFAYQRPQHIMTRLAEDMNVIFIEEPVSANGAEPHLELTKLDENILLIVPHTNEEGWGFNDQHNAVIGPLLVDFLSRSPMILPDPVGGEAGYGVWFYTPQALPLLQHLDPELIVFDIMDETPEFGVQEAALLSIADIVIAGSPSLFRAKSLIRPDTINLPSAVDGTWYSPANAAALESEKHVEDRLEQHIPTPRIGFFGVIDERLDVELIEFIADSEPTWHIVMVGPVAKIDPAILPSRKNIHWLGSQLYADLPMIVQGWDVCMLPLAINDSTEFISPTQTLEYMVAEKPIVSSPVRDVIDLYGDFVRIANTKEAFIECIQSCLDETPEQASARNLKAQRTVDNQSWDAAVDTIYNAIERALINKVK